MTKWANRGVWASVGLVVGVLACSIFQSQRVEAVATSGATEGSLLATGASANASIEYVWHLDDRGNLTCHLMGPQNRHIASQPLDIKQAMKGKGGKKGKYAMVTGRWTQQGQISDVLYLTESTSNAIAVFTMNNDGLVQLVGTLGGASR